MKFLIILLFAIFMAGCTDASTTRSILEAEGYTNIVIKGYTLLTCGEDDVVHTGFTATTASGTRVSGTVCCGLVFKDCTIRISK